MKNNLDNEYRKINSRMQKLYKEAGYTQLYNQYMTAISRNFETRVDKNGAIQIVRGGKNKAPNKFQLNVLSRLSKMPTYQNLVNEARQSIKDSGKKATKERIDKYIKQKDYVESNKDLISWVSDQINSGKEVSASLRQLYDRLAGRDDIPSYEVLNYLMKKAKGERIGAN